MSSKHNSAGVYVGSLHTHQVEEGEGSLLFAGGELADLAGCGDSFT